MYNYVYLSSLGKMVLLPCKKVGAQSLCDAQASL